MIRLTVRTGRGFDATAREAVDTAVISHGGSAAWREHPALGRAYGAIAVPTAAGAGAVRAALTGDAVAYDAAVAALAVFPADRSAVPALLEALGGPGRPAGVLACEPCEGGAIVEWDPQRTAPSVVAALVDAELARAQTGRRILALAPLPLDVVAAIAADGLQAPGVAPDRILEHLLEGVESR